VSPEHFCRAFRRQIGTTCQRYSTLLRIEHARALLVGSSIAIDEIAIVSGFSDQSHLTRLLSAGLGTTPARIRKDAHGRGRIPLFLDENADFV
jgi:transcriptional regulator GlxA family with amidase domain